MGKIGCWNKKRAVLAIFYCGCKQSKSFHIPPSDRREDKGTHFFRNRKIRPRFSAKTGIRRNGSSPRFRRRAPASGPAMKRRLPTAPGFAKRKSHRFRGGFHHSYRGAAKDHLYPLHPGGQKKSRCRQARTVAGTTAPASSSLRPPRSRRCNRTSRRGP